MSKPFLSPSSAGKFDDCPRCFWTEKVKKIAPPRGIVASIMGGIDRTMKAWHDEHRPLGRTPDMVQELPDGTALFGDQPVLERWRNWKTGLRHETEEFECGGAVDDVVVESDGLFSPLDYKSRGSEPPDGYAEKYYQHQVDIYALLLNANGMRPSGKAYFRFAWPTFDAKSPDGLRFAGKFVAVAVDMARGEDLLRRAAACLLLPSAPESDPECEICAWHEKMKKAGM
jgi:hypothetical protein